MLNSIKKTTTKYTGLLIRMDDIAENMNWDMMEHATNLFNKFEVKPVIGVIPNNEDPELLSYPKKNKHLVFDGHLFHGVIGPLSKIKPTKDSKRITLLINYWKKKPIEPNCVHPPYELLSLVPLTKEHVQLQESVTKEKSKVIKMNYKHGTRNLNIFRNNTPINIILAKSLQAMKTYSFKFNRINVVSVDTYSNY